MNQQTNTVHCPKCKSTQIQIIEKKRFGWGRGCLGAIFFLPLIFLGFTKSGKIQRFCMNCGKTF
ncbi:hypothetical protein CMT52_07765 [Elizabethkingia anophelis]|nr:hypothetical protein [Elizabethkingia anophelis]